MRILWFPRLQFDVDRLHITTWREMCNSLENKGVYVKIAVAGNDVNKVLDRPYIKIPIIRIKFLRILTFWVNGYLKFIRNYLAYKPNVVILDIYSIWFSFPFVFFVKKRCLFILDNRTPMYGLAPDKCVSTTDRFMQLYTKIAYQYCRYFLDGMTVITSYYKRKICVENHFKASDIGVWSSGVNTEIFSTQKYRKSQRPPFLKGKFVLMQHGALGLRRGQFETIEAIGLIENKDIVFVLIGEGKVKNIIFQKIRELELEERVYVLPAVPYCEVPAYVSYCDCAVMAYPDIEYWNNNNPIKLLEYFAMGKVVICSDVWTFRDVAEDKKCACYIPNNAPAAIADAITYCYNNKAFLDEWGREGIEIVQERYTWDEQVENLLRFIKQLYKKQQLLD